MKGSSRNTVQQIVQRVFFLVCLISSAAVHAQTPKVVAPARVASAAASHAETPERFEAEKPEPNDRAHQSVKVHGHWALDVTNADGTIAKHVEFENSLLLGEGDQLLALSLTGRLAAADWGFQLNGNAGDPPLCSNGIVFCYGVSSLSGLLGQEFCAGASAPQCTTGTMAVPTAKIDQQPFAYGISITGTIKPLKAGNITSVQTLLSGCTETYTSPQAFPGLTSFNPKSCATSNLTTLNNNNQFILDIFTSTSSFTPIPVAIGQMVAITVTISFS